MTCFSMLRGRVVRVTRVDECGTPVRGPSSVIVSEGITEIGFSVNQTEGETVEVPNFGGKICVYDQPSPQLTGYGVEINFCEVNPELYAMLSGQTVVYDSEDNPVGFRVNSSVDANAQGFALEAWTGVAGAACEEGAGSVSGYLLVPFLKGGTLGDFSLENNAITFTITGAQTKDGTNWGVGPYDVVLDGGVPGPLLGPLDANDHLHIQSTNVAPPEPECDAFALGVPATGATAGTPGTWAPENSYAPADMAELVLSDPTASPSTDWSAGSYVQLRDGSIAHWDGDEWVEGTAP